MEIAGSAPLARSHEQGVAAGQPVRLAVENLRDGRRLAHRRVTIADEGRLGFELVARFASPRPGPELARRPLDPTVPAPDALPHEEEVAERLGWEWWEPGALEQRWVGDPWQPDGGTGTHDVTWVRLREPLPIDPGLQVGLIAYLSDVHSHWPVARSLNGRWEPDGFTSLDEVIWLHSDAIWDDWWLLTSRCVAAAGGRALTTRELCTGDGTLVASMAQEALIPDAE